MEPMAALTAPHRTAAQHQSLLHFVSEGQWLDEQVLAKVREMVADHIGQRHDNHPRLRPLHGVASQLGC
jgi:SRSO17 transposase